MAMNHCQLSLGRVVQSSPLERDEEEEHRSCSTDTSQQSTIGADKIDMCLGHRGPTSWVYGAHVKEREGPYDEFLNNLIHFKSVARSLAEKDRCVRYRVCANCVI
jgi:hypothetical protein